MLAVFCDLDVQWHREFREWLRDDMMPARMRIGFAAAASYDLISGAAADCASPEPFVTLYETASIGDLYGAPYQGLRANRDPRDIDFHARFIRPARYTLSWVGPELVYGSSPPPASTGAGSGARFAPVAVFDRFELPESAVQDFNLWYMTQHLPNLAAIPGLARVRRYLAMEGSPRHVVVHELDSHEELDSPPWLASRAAMMDHMGKASRHVAGAYSRVVVAETWMRTSEPSH